MFSLAFIIAHTFSVGMLSIIVLHVDRIKPPFLLAASIVFLTDSATSCGVPKHMI